MARCGRATRQIHAEHFDMARDRADVSMGHDYAGNIGNIIDAEVERLLVEQQERTRRILGEHRDAVEAVAHALIEHETLSGDAVAAIVSQLDPDPLVRDVGPWPPRHRDATTNV